MRSQNHFGTLIGAGLLGLAAVAIAPRLYGGGGDEGVDILPATGGASAGAAMDGPHFGYVAIHGENLHIDSRDEPVWSGLLVGGHSRADIFFGRADDVPTDDPVAIDLMTKGRRELAFSELLDTSNGIPASSLHFNGRFQVEDVDPRDGEKLESVGYLRRASVVQLLVGRRASRDGSVRESFKSVDFMLFQSVPSGSVDLVALREASVQALAGSGYDVGVTLYAKARRGLDEVTVAWNVDDARALYDVDVRLR